MEEEIKVLEEFVKENRNWHCIECGYNCEKDMKTEKAIENLINKYKEQEKMIELMNEYILKNCVSLEICSKQIGKECYIDVIYDDECKECVIEFFRKKAKGE